MVKVLELAGKLLNTHQKRDLAHRGLNLVFALATVNTFHNTEAWSEEFFINLFSLYSFAYEVLKPNSYNGVLGALNASAASFSFFTNPINSVMHGYNTTHRFINKLNEVAEESRNEVAGIS